MIALIFMLENNVYHKICTILLISTWTFQNVELNLFWEMWLYLKAVVTDD